jgi:hypothetical protein
MCMKVKRFVLFRGAKCQKCVDWFPQTIPVVYSNYKAHRHEKPASKYTWVPFAQLVFPPRWRSVLDNMPCCKKWTTETGDSSFPKTPLCQCLLAQQAARLCWSLGYSKNRSGPL